MSRSKFILAVISLFLACVALILVFISSQTGAIPRGKVIRTADAMRGWVAALAEYKAQTGRLPVVDGDLHLLKESYPSNFPAILPADDGWNTPLRYSSDGRYFTIVSYGSDRRPGPSKHAESRRLYDHDIVIEDSGFTQGPFPTSRPASAAN